MQLKELALTFEEITEADIPELTKVMTAAFDDDARRHLGKERGGPEGYDNGDFWRKWLFGHEDSVGYKIIVQNKIIGGILVWIREDGNNAVGALFMEPPYQDQGIGTRAWQYIEASYPDTRSWTLDTPHLAIRNHHFYEEKCGFTRVGAKDDFLLTFRKEMSERVCSSSDLIKTS